MQGQQKSQLVQFSFLMLFVELALIRVTSANFMFLAFFANYILMASFLGIAIGFLRVRQRFNLFKLAPVLLAALLYFCYRLHFEYQINLNPDTDDLNYFVNFLRDHDLPIQFTLPLIFIAVTAIMATFAHGTARAFQQLPPLLAYRMEIIGSLLGVIAFTVLAFMQATPLIWGIIICLMYSSLQIATWRLKPLWLIMQLPALTVILLLLHFESSSPLRLWSPYYKIAVLPYSHGRFAIDVNGAPQQFVESVKQRHIYKPFYFLPYEHLAQQFPLKNVLVIGAGTGGDVAIALAQGAEHVDAVEIDPVLLDLGKQLNPDSPYMDPRVTLHLNDGRAFLQQSTQRYDMIIFALTDSMTILSHHSSLRLENYLLTMEGMMAARTHLQPDGVFTIYNYCRTPWIVDRLGVTLKAVYGQLPCLDTEGSRNMWLSVLTVSPSATALRCKNIWQPHSATLPLPSTDDKPFIYLNTDDFSIMYPFCLIFIGLMSLAALQFSGGSYRAVYRHFDLFLMGAAFLLLETKNVVNFALLFGTTWLVNGLVFIGILSTVTLAILVTERRKSMRLSLLSGLLFASLMLSLMIPNHYLLILPYIPRLIAACALAFAPIFFANLIFAGRFRETTQSTDAFAANIFGAIAGGLLEYSSMIIGYQNLLLMVAGLYMLAIACMKLHTAPQIVADEMAANQI